MKIEDRIAVIKNFVEGHRFLVGLQYRVVYDEGTDMVTVEFKTIPDHRLYSFRSSMNAHNMGHIKAHSDKVTKEERKQRFKKHKL